MSKNLARQVTGLTLLTTIFIAGSTWAAPADSASGSSTFQSNCAACHGPDGAGTAAGRSLNVVDLRSAAVQGQSNAQLQQIVKNGINNMPAFSDSLTDQQIAAVVEHVRTFGKQQGSTASH